MPDFRCMYWVQNCWQVFLINRNCTPALHCTVHCTCSCSCSSWADVIFCLLLPPRPPTFPPSHPPHPTHPTSLSPSQERLHPPPPPPSPPPSPPAGPHHTTNFQSDVTHLTFVPFFMRIFGPIQSVPAEWSLTIGGTFFSQIHDPNVSINATETSSQNSCNKNTSSRIRSMRLKSSQNKPVHLTIRVLCVLVSDCEQGDGNAVQ